MKSSQIPVNPFPVSQILFWLFYQMKFLSFLIDTTSFVESFPISFQSEKGIIGLFCECNLKRLLLSRCYHRFGLDLITSESGDSEESGDSSEESGDSEERGTVKKVVTVARRVVTVKSVGQ
jgi:hypothetical protein